MRKLVLAALILAVTATAADARRRHHRHHYYYQQAPVMLMGPGAVEAMRSPRGRIDGPARFVPRDWQLMPPDPNWQGRRYMAPDGNAWLAFYATNAANDATARFKAVAFADGEDVKYLRGEHDRLTVSGLKGDRIFYRKVMLACGGTIWRHVAMEYPASAKATFDRFVEGMSRGFDRIADDSCGDNLFSSPQPANAQPKGDEKAKPDEKPAPN
jgi:serine/threonine-protein kinase